MAWLQLLPMALGFVGGVGDAVEEGIHGPKRTRQKIELEAAQARARKYGSGANYEFVQDRQVPDMKPGLSGLGQALQAMEADKKNHPDKNTGTQDSIVKSEWFDHAKGLAEKGDDPEGYDLLDPYKYE